MGINKCFLCYWFTLKGNINMPYKTTFYHLLNTLLFYFVFMFSHEQRKPFSSRWKCLFVSCLISYFHINNMRRLFFRFHNRICSPVLISLTISRWANKTRIANLVFFLFLLDRFHLNLERLICGFIGWNEISWNIKRNFQTQSHFI